MPRARRVLSRATVLSALEHRYLATLHQADDEPEGPNIPRHEFNFETMRLSPEELKDEILREVEMHHHPSRDQGGGAAAEDMSLSEVTGRMSDLDMGAKR